MADRDLISRRTKEGLEAARARGVKLGRPRTVPDKVRGDIRRWYWDEGVSLGDIARRLNGWNVPSARGGKWGTSSVAKIANEPPTPEVSDEVRAMVQRLYLNEKDPLQNLLRFPSPLEPEGEAYKRLHTLAERLNKCNIRSAAGGKWTVYSVERVLRGDTL